MSIIQGNAHSGGEYQISRSLRFNSADSAYLNRTPASASNRKTWTWSAWVKRSALSAEQTLFFAGTSSTSRFQFVFGSSDNLVVYHQDASANDLLLITSAVYRDVSAFYHVVLAVDTTQASANMFKLYVNGVQVTAFSTNTNTVSASEDLNVNSTDVHNIGRRAYDTTNYLNGYLTEINFIDGQALTPSDFGLTDPQTGVWVPKKYTGTYGTNGFYLNFSDNSGTTSTTLGKDSSGNSNNWTPNNFSVTAGAGNDSLVDSPTAYGTDTGVGGEVRGNYCTLNPLALNPSTTASTLTNGNLDASASAANTMRKATISITGGKWYFEATLGNTIQGFGLGESAVNSFGTNSSTAGARTYYLYNATLSIYTILPGADTLITTTVGSGGTLAVAIDMDAKKLWLGYAASGGGSITWVSGGSPASGTTPTHTIASDVTELFPLALTNGPTLSCNFGQRAFAYTAPSGFKALCTTNLPTPTIGATSTTQANKYFDVKLYVGNAPSTNTISGVGFAPDFVWVKNRETAGSNHVLVDSVRGNTKGLYSNATDAEATDAGFPTLTSDGFTVADSSWANQSTKNLVSWLWNAGGSNATNTSGTITSTVRANTTAGFSIVTYTGTGSAATVGHGLGVAPSMVIVKRRNSTGSWPVYHISLPSANYELFLERTDAQGTPSNSWNNTAPTSTVFSIGTGTAVNTNTGTYVAYCFAEVAGYSAAFSYTGNGSTDGPFVFLNMRPRWILLKRTDTTGNWTIIDTSREGYNVDNDPLYPNLADAEGTADLADILSNGFKLRSTDASVNANTGTYIGFAVSENPFKYSLGR